MPEILNNFGLSQGVLKFGVVIVIILAGILIGRIIGRAIKRLTKEIELDKIIKDLLNVSLPLENLASKIVSWIIYFIAVLFALDQIGLGSTTLDIVLMFILVVITIILILSLKDFIPNIIAGFIIYSKGNIRKGIRLKVNNIRGTVISVSLLETKIKAGKEIIFIPNSILLKNRVIIRKNEN
ncbi:mechanosensitive ion channel [Candidatus Woesearchaeota archaeon]|nr:mechanosensitive ion channel [Candidatus Woesearchaeota archaeon]